MKRNMDVELATTCGMLHDIYYMTGGKPNNHAAEVAVQAESILKSMDAYSNDEIRIITAAISRHSEKRMIHEPLTRC